MTNDVVSYAVIGAIIVVVIIVVAIIMKKRKKKLVNLNECKHDFKLGGVLMFYEKYPRIIYYCNKCGYAIHKPVAKYSAE